MYKYRRDTIKMDTQNLADLQRDAEAYKRILASNLRSYHRRYETDMEFRIRESKRNSEAIMKKYNSDPEYRQRMIDAAKARYYAKKRMAERDKQD
jgi:hypothetical protein